jgi:hypothetical protein
MKNATVEISISTQEKSPRTEYFSKISLLKVENFQLQNIFPHGKFASANHILQNFLSAENFPERKWPYLQQYKQTLLNFRRHFLFGVPSKNLLILALFYR